MFSWPLDPSRCDSFYGVLGDSPLRLHTGVSQECELIAGACPLAGRMSLCSTVSHSGQMGVEGFHEAKLSYVFDLSRGMGSEPGCTLSKTHLSMTSSNHVNTEIGRRPGQLGPMVPMTPVYRGRMSKCATGASSKIREETTSPYGTWNTRTLKCNLQGN